MFDLSDFFVVLLALTLLPIGSGFYSVLASPILLPIYPAVLAGGILKGKRSLKGIVLGFTISFGVFALVLSTIIYATYLQPDIMRYVAIFLSALFGLFMIFANKLTIKDTTNDLAKGFIYGLILGFIWSTWVGPFMPQLDYYAPKSVDFYLTCLTLMFGLGASLFISILVYLVQKIIELTKPSLTITKAIWQILGSIMILIALAVTVHLVHIPPREEFVHPAPNIPLHELFNLNPK